jgi:hypothetical protein
VNRAIICADRAFPGDCAGFLRFAHPGKPVPSG